MKLPAVFNASLARLRQLPAVLKRPSLAGIGPRLQAAASWLLEQAQAGLARLRTLRLQELLEPAVERLNRLRYPTKFSLLGAVAVLSIGFFVVSLTIAMRGEIEAARSERIGLRVYLPALQLVHLTQQHMAMASGVQAGEASFSEPLEATRSEIDKALKDQQAALKDRDGMEQARRRLAAINDEWKKLRAFQASEAAQVASSHARINALQTDLLRDIGEASGLIGDARPDSSFLADALVRKAPGALQALGTLRSNGISLLTGKEMTAEWRKVAPQVEGLQGARDDLSDTLKRAVRAGGPSFARLDTGNTAFVAGVKDILETVDSEITRGAWGVSPTDYDAKFAAVSAIIAKQSATEVMPLLDGLLYRRIGELSTQFWASMTVAAVMLALLTYFSVAMFFDILGSVSQLAQGAREIGTGRLAYRIDFRARDELSTVATQFNQMAESFAVVIREAQGTAAELSHTSAALAASASQVSRGSERQSEAASSMAAAIEQMTVGIDEISRHATEAESVSNRSGELSVEGGEVVGRTVEEMERIAEAVNQSAEVISELGRNSAQISSIVKSIKGIADQTNLLALNASIEAARAGEAGRGFAVVADEVRKLSERTGRATQEISTMVAAIQSGTNRAVAAMNEGVMRVRGGVELTSQAGQAMLGVREESSRVVQSISDISLALREQSAASTEIAKTIEHIARMAEENSAAVADTASTAAGLEKLARELNDEVSRFTL